MSDLNDLDKMWKNGLLSLMTGLYYSGFKNKSQEEQFSEDLEIPVKDFSGSGVKSYFNKDLNE